MSELIHELLGWLGYLQRVSVLLQLLGLLVALGLARGMVPRLRGPARVRSWQPLLQALAGPLLGLLLAGLLRLGGMPFGLLRLGALLWLGWNLLTLSGALFPRWIPEERMQTLQSRLLRPLYLIGAALVLINQLGNLEDLALIPIGRLFGVPIDLGRLFSVLLAGFLLLAGSGPPAAGLAWLTQKLIGLTDGSRRALEQIIRYGLIGVGLLALGFHVGLNPTALLAIAGGLSIGLGFGIKEVFANFVSGLWLLVEGSVRPGEVLMIDGDACEVRRLGPRATLLWRDRDNAEILIPNQTFFTERATTYTASDSLRRSQVSVGAAYHHRPRQVMALLEATALAVPRVLPHPPPKALLLSYGDSGVSYALRFWIANPMDNISICSAVNEAIWEAFQAHGIEIPYPQQVQYHRPWPPPPGDPPKSDPLHRSPEAGGS